MMLYILTSFIIHLEGKLRPAMTDCIYSYKGSGCGLDCLATEALNILGSCMKFEPSMKMFVGKC